MKRQIPLMRTPGNFPCCTALPTSCQSLHPPTIFNGVFYTRVEGSILRRTGLLLSILLLRPLIQRVYGPALCYVITRIKAPGAYCPGGLWSVINVTGRNRLEGRAHSHGRRLIALAVGGVLLTGPKAKVMEQKGKSQPMTLKSVDKGDK